MLDDTGGGLLRILVATGLLALTVGGVLYANRIGPWLTRTGRRLHLLAPPAPTPLGAPLERIAADLRRLEPEARRHRPGTPNAKFRGVVAAYDDLLLAACRALGVSTDLGSLPEGLERESERLRVESELVRAGLPISTVP